jgi:hypothetical protein
VAIEQAVDDDLAEPALHYGSSNAHHQKQSEHCEEQHYLPFPSSSSEQGYPAILGPIANLVTTTHLAHQDRYEVPSIRDAPLARTGR